MTFSRAVVDFDETSPSLGVQGATVASVSPHLVTHEPAHSYLIALTPDGDGTITVRLLTDHACSAGGVCTADGTTLSEAPPTRTIGRAPNDDPEFPSTTTTRSVDENTGAGQSIRDPVAAADDDGDALTYSLSGTDADSFAIDPGNGQLQTKAALDHEGDDSYTVIVGVSDGKDADRNADSAVDDTITVHINVADIDEPPVITGPERGGDYPENSSISRRVGRYTATDPEGAGVTWSALSGRDADAFDLSNAGVLTFRTSPDYEDQTEYRVRLNAYDGDLTGMLDLVVTIADVNEPPVVARSSGTGAFSIVENSGTAGGSFTATDPERGAVTWSLARSGDHARFAIDANDGVLSLKEAPDYESDDLGADKAYHVTVRAAEQDDADPLTTELTGSLPVTVRVTDVNEAPTLTGNLTPGVRENTTAVGTYSATDPERVTITWSLPGAGADDFTISSGGALAFTSAPDYEARTQHSVTVRASDGPHDVDRDVTVTVTDVDEREALALSDRRPLIGIAYTAAFEEGTGDAVQSPTWAWARSTSKTSGFTTIGGATGATYLPAGADRDHYLRVTASYDDGHGTKSLSTVSDFATQPDSGTNTPPTFPSPLFTGGVMGLSVREDATRGTLVGTAPQATDAENDPLRYSLEVSGVSGDPPFEINAVSRQIRVAAGAPLDHEKRGTYSVTVTAEDDFNATATATFDITIVDVNEPPVAVADPSVTTAEDTAVTFDVLANDTDPDAGDTLSVAGAAQPRRGRVEVDATTQRLTYTPAEHDHGTYTFGYAASDGSLTSTRALVTVTITPVNDAPEFAAGTATRTVSESAGPGDPVGAAVTATDVDHPDLTYRLAGAPDFVIDGATGQIRVAPGVTLDREDTPSYTATVTTSDDAGGADSIIVTITIDNVNDPPVAANDTVTTDEDTAVSIDVLANDTDPDTERATLTASVLTQPLNGRARVESDGTITYTPNANVSGTDSFTYRVSDGALSDDASVTVTVSAVNDIPEFPTPTAARSVPGGAETGDPVGAPVAATDVDEGDTLVYSLSGMDAASFVIDPDGGQITVAPGVTFDAATLDTYEVAVNVSDGNGGTSGIEVTITVTTGPVGPPIVTGPIGPGGGGGPSGPGPSNIEFEWTVTHDIEELDSDHDTPSGMWSDGTTLWLAQNGSGADDEIYAYDLETGERVEDRDFDLDERNRAPRGVWSDGQTVWIADSGRERLFAHNLASGDRLEGRDIVLHEDNRDARGIWSDGEILWVLDGGRNALFAYDLASGDLVAEYALHDANDDPRGLWSDGVSVWVSDHGAKRLFAYRLPEAPAEPAAEDAEAHPLERVREEEFTELSKASNNSPRGLWSDGAVMYVADESDDRVYSYNLPGAVDARLASLSLSGVDFGEFDGSRSEYEGVAAESVTVTTVEAEAAQAGATVAIEPADADGDPGNGHQAAIDDGAEIAVTVTSEDGSRTRVYRVRLSEAAPEPWLRGDVAVGFSFLTSAGGSVDDVAACARERRITALYTTHDGAFVPHILGAPEFVNRPFRALYGDGLPPATPLLVTSAGPPSVDAGAGGELPQSWLRCLRGEVAEGFSLVLYQGGSVAELGACAQEHHVTALYALRDGAFVAYILGAPEFVSRPFRDLFADGVPAATPVLAKSEGP